MSSIKCPKCGGLIFNLKADCPNCGWSAEYESTYNGEEPRFSEDGMTVTYGLYPQTHVSDEETKKALKALTWQDRNKAGWYKYKGSFYAYVHALPVFPDPNMWEFDGECCVLTDTRYLSFDDGEEIKPRIGYWFKCEPIEWIVLSQENGKLSLLSKYILDCSQFNAPHNLALQADKFYAGSSIRKWLLGCFYPAAFSLDNSHIVGVELDNWERERYNFYALIPPKNTFDKIYLLSFADYYEDKSQYKMNGESRKCKPTDYARANGCPVMGGVRNKELPNQEWPTKGGIDGPYWIRTLGPRSFWQDGLTAGCVNAFGSLEPYMNFRLVNEVLGVRPGITICIDNNKRH